MAPDFENQANLMTTGLREVLQHRHFPIKLPGGVLGRQLETIALLLPRQPRVPDLKIIPDKIILMGVRE